MFTTHRVKVTIIPSTLEQKLGIAQVRQDTIKLYCVPVSSRVNLWISNGGFAFTMASKSARQVVEPGLDDWQDWERFYPLYLRDNLVKTLTAFLDTFPERAKCERFYQAIHFDAKFL